MRYNVNDIPNNADLVFYHKDFWEIENSEIYNTDMNFYHCGEHECAKGHSWGPAVRDHYLIHYIVSGKGSFKYKNKIYELGAGNGFLICPDQVAFYQADLEDPWHYYWVGFNGINAQKILHQAGLSSDSPIFFSDDYEFFIKNIGDMADANKFEFEKVLYRMGFLYLFLSKLIEVASKRKATNYNHSIIEEYVKSAIDYIDRNLFCDLSVNDVSKYIGINRKYLYTIFKKIVGQTPMEYIIKRKMNKACEFLANKSLSIAEVSYSVGYNDQFTFSKQFKKIFGTSPSIYRREYLNKLTNKE